MVSPMPAAIEATQAVFSRPDIELFVDHVAWLGGYLKDPSRLGVMSWLGRSLRPEVRAELSGLFRADHPIQIQAEKELLVLLRRPWQKHAPRYARLDMPERNVDWARTYIEELTAPPARFWSREVVPMLDGGLLGGLCSLGRTMLDLGSFGSIDLERRSVRAALEQAIAMVSRTIGRHHASYTSLHEQRLLRMDGETRRCALSLRSYLEFFRDRFGESGDRDGLQALTRRIGEADLRCDRRTLDSLLEISAAIAIARAAVSTVIAADLPDGIPWELVDVDERDEKNVPRIRLRAGPLSCVISKDAPNDDTLVPLLRQMGLSARGNQPDIVMTFTLTTETGRQESILVLADAKRNAEDDGRRYLASSVETAIVYAVSYGHRMGLRIHPNGTTRIDGDVLPAVTLFCRQGVKTIAGVGPREEDIVARLRSADPLPAVLALDLSHIRRSQEETDVSPILRAWLGRIARQAKHTLKQRLLAPRGPEAAPISFERDRHSRRVVSQQVERR